MIAHVNTSRMCFHPFAQPVRRDVAGDNVPARHAGLPREHAADETLAAARQTVEEQAARGRHPERLVARRFEERTEEIGLQPRLEVPVAGDVAPAERLGHDGLSCFSPGDPLDARGHQRRRCHAEEDRTTFLQVDEAEADPAQGVTGDVANDGGDLLPGEERNVTREEDPQLLAVEHRGALPPQLVLEEEEGVAAAERETTQGLHLDPELLPDSKVRAGELRLRDVGVDLVDVLRDLDYPLDVDLLPREAGGEVLEQHGLQRHVLGALVASLELRVGDLVGGTVEERVREARHVGEEAGELHFHAVVVEELGLDAGCARERRHPSDQLPVARLIVSGAARPRARLGRRRREDRPHAVGVRHEGLAYEGRQLVVRHVLGVVSHEVDGADRGKTLRSYAPPAR